MEEFLFGSLIYRKVFIRDILYLKPIHVNKLNKNNISYFSFGNPSILLFCVR